MKVRSISDVITNSSSEVFIIHYPKKSASEILGLLKRYQGESDEEETCSGEGGIISVQEVCKSEERKELFESRIPWIPGSLEIRIDWALLETIRRFREDSGEDAYNIEEETRYPIWNKEGTEILQVTKDYQRWKSLRDPFLMHGVWAIENMDWWNYESRD